MKKLFLILLLAVSSLSYGQSCAPTISTSTRFAGCIEARPVKVGVANFYASLWETAYLNPGSTTWVYTPVYNGGALQTVGTEVVGYLCQGAYGPFPGIVSGASVKVRYINFSVYGSQGEQLAYQGMNLPQIYQVIKNDATKWCDFSNETTLTFSAPSGAKKK